MKLESTVGGGYTTKEMYPSSGIYNTTVFSYQVSRSSPSKSENTTLENVTSSQTDSGDFNRTLIILIKIFGIVDILLICIYLGIVMHDHRNKRTVKQTINIDERINDIYENVEILFA